MLNKYKNKSIIISSEIHQIIIGSLLGDLHIERRKYKRKDGSIGIGNSRLSFQQEDKNVEYLMWIWKKFSSAGFLDKEKKPKLYTRIYKKNSIRYYYKLNSYTYINLNLYHDRFYKEGIKIVPRDLEKDITSLSLAVWFMDDGCLMLNGVKLSTNSYKKEEVEYLCKLLKKKFNITSTLNKTGIENQYIIYVNKESRERFIRLISKHLTEGMKDRKKIGDSKYPREA